MTAVIHRAWPVERLPLGGSKTTSALLIRFFSVVGNLASQRRITLAYG